MRPQLQHLILPFLICFFVHFANGQDIKDGFIVLPDGKYQYGLIQLDPVLKAYEECLFKPENKNEFRKYTPDKVNGYGIINGTYFVTRKISIEGVEQQHFLKNEVDALVKVYSFEGNRFFVEKDDFKELHQDNYKALLSEALAACKTIQSAIRKSSFDPSSLQSLFIKYQRCSSPESITLSAKRVKFDVLVGMESNTSTLKASANFSKSNIPLTDKTLLSVGLNTTIPFKESKHLSFATGLYYYQQNFYGVTHSVIPDVSSTDKVNLDFHEILIPLALHYSLFKSDRKIMPYLKGGVTVPVTLKSSFEWVTETEYTDEVFYEHHNGLPQHLKQTPSLILSAGTTLQVLNSIRNVLEISYISGRGKLENDTSKFTTDGNRLIILLGFRF